MDEDRLSVIVVTYESSRVIEACLASVGRAAPDAQVIVVDNASVDGTADVVATVAPTAVLIRNRENVGFAQAVNAGVRCATGRWAMLLNPDALVTPAAVCQLLEAAAGGNAVVGPRLVNVDGSVQRSAFRFPSPVVLLLEQLGLGGRVPWLDGPTRRGPQSVAGCAPVDWLKGACLVSSTALLRRLGPFDPGFFMFGEDVDLALRLRGSGGETRYCPGAVVTHEGGASTAQHPGRMVVCFFESTYRLYRLHWPERLAAVGAVIRFVALVKLLRLIAAGALALIRGRPGTALRQVGQAWVFVQAFRLHPRGRGPGS